MKIVKILVSNPFRTGRYCADDARHALRKAQFCFKPLQNGAVLCCGGGEGISERRFLFQTPSERGGIVLNSEADFFSSSSSRFKPLQNGAVLCCRPFQRMDNAR